MRVQVSLNFMLFAYFRLNAMRASKLFWTPPELCPTAPPDCNREINKVTSGDTLEVIQKSMTRTMPQEPLTITGKEYRSFADKGGRVGLKHTLWALCTLMHFCISLRRPASLQNRFRCIFSPLKPQIYPVWTPPPGTRMTPRCHLNSTPSPLPDLL